MSGPADTFKDNRAEKLRRIEELGLDPWGGRFDDHEPVGRILERPTDAPTKPRVKAAGRIGRRRDMGKVLFVDIVDWTGRIQVYLGKKQIGDTNWAVAEALDLGDLIGVEGEYGLTKTGEKTIFADALTFLGKSLLPHPDKWSGMQDPEYRLRHRYLDLVYSPEVLDRTLKRTRIVRRIRTYLEEQGFIEVETPTLHAIAGGAAARPFTTHHNALDIDLYLRIALELHLKRLLVGGIERVFELGRVFRNEGISPRHNPEFTMLEVYQAYGDYGNMMDLTEGLILACVETLGGGMQLPYGERSIDFTPPWPRQAYAELFAQHVGQLMNDAAAVARCAQQNGIPTQGVDPAVLTHKLFEAVVEPRLKELDRPLFVYDYPAALCPLTKRKRGAPDLAERFELYVCGMEIANAYTELNDPVMQEQTFRQQLAGLAADDSMARMDEDFIRALQHGMPPAGGLGIGIDRLVMLLTNAQSIRDVILFPLLRPEAK